MIGDNETNTIVLQFKLLASSRFTRDCRHRKKTHNVQVNQQALPELQAGGATLLAVSPQTPDHGRALAEKLDLTFALLSDAGNQVARQFGLVFTLDEAVRAAHRQVGADLPRFNGDSSWELPLAGTFLVDQSGTILLAFVNPDFTRLLDPSVIIARLKDLQG